MCGICGIYSPVGEPVDRVVLGNMLATLAHRGPDDEGMCVQGSVGLGHRRLSIIDLSGGHQPMSNEDQTIWLTYNGEIYNYVELRQRHLEGHVRLRTRSDTEVLLRLYERFGTDAVTHLNGMFAFALWDAKKQRLWLARDRLGEKPLYYFASENLFAFASEIKALLRHPSIKALVRPEGVDEFFTFGYVQGEDTIFQGIHRLEPGQELILERGGCVIRRYWDVGFEPRKGVSELDAVEEVEALLVDAIRVRLRSDVPVGVLLSGGIDSSTVVALLAEHVPGNIKTFSIGFDFGPQFNELKHARRVADAFETDHHELVLAPDKFQEFIPRFVECMEEPVTEAAAIPLFYVSQLASSHVKVILSGEGADEIFAGYPIYRYMKLIDTYRRFVPAELHRLALAPFIRCFSRSAKLDKYVFLAGQPLERRYLNVRLYDHRQRTWLYDSAFMAAVGQDAPLAKVEGIFRRTDGWDLLSRLLYFDTHTWLPNDLLIKADRMSMANSIELRVPFLDHRLVELAASLPSRMKMRGRTMKYVLKKMAETRLPAEITHRGKMGFPTPVGQMLRDSLRAYTEERLLEGKLREKGYFRRDRVRTALREHMQAQKDHHQLLWRLLILEEWHQTFLAS